MNQGFVTQIVTELLIFIFILILYQHSSNETIFCNTSNEGSRYHLCNYDVYTHKVVLFLTRVPKILIIGQSVTKIWCYKVLRVRKLQFPRKKIVKIQTCAIKVLNYRNVIFFAYKGEQFPKWQPPPTPELWRPYPTPTFRVKLKMVA